MRARKPVRLVPLDSHNVPSGRTTTISTSTVTTTTLTTYMHAVQLRGGGDAPLAPRRMVRDDSPTAHGARRFTHTTAREGRREGGTGRSTGKSAH